MKKLWRDSGANEIAEAAVVLPVLIMIMLGIISFGRAFNVYSTITRAAQDGAVVAAQSSCGSCGNANTNNSTVAKAVTDALAASKVSTDGVSTYTLASEPDPCSGFTGAGCTTDSSSKIRICRNVKINDPGTGPQQCGVIVSFQYDYHLQVPLASINLQTIQLKAVAERQMEN